MRDNQKRRKKMFAEERLMKGVQWKDEQIENFIKNKSSVINKWYDAQEEQIYDKGADLTELEKIEKEKHSLIVRSYSNLFFIAFESFVCCRETM